MERKISVELYVAAFILTVIIFAIGVYIGGIINKNTAEELKTEVKHITSRLQNFQLLFLLDNETETSGSFCFVYTHELSLLEDETERMRYKIAYLEESKGTVDEGLKNEYFILETNAYLLSKKINEKCSSNETLVLYFYSNKNCPTCYQQGIDLYEAKQKLRGKNITAKVYAFDGDLNSSITEAFKVKYDIAGYPLLVINEKKVYGPLNVDEIVKKIGEQTNSS